jgi:hypothetical protein
VATRQDLTGKPASPALDAAGAALSSLCLIHCLALPLLALLMPAAAAAGGHSHGDDLLLHLLLVGIALPVSLVAFRRGLRLHGRTGPLMLGLSGFALMLAGAFAHGVSVQALTLAGGLMVAGAHLFNWRALRLA